MSVDFQRKVNHAMTYRAQKDVDEKLHLEVGPISFKLLIYHEVSVMAVSLMHQCVTAQLTPSLL